MKLVSIVIVTYNSSDVIGDAVESIFTHLDPAIFELIIVDNNSTDNTVQLIRSFAKDIRLIENKVNKGFASANNQGFRVAEGEYILVFNPDMVLTENTNVPALMDILAAQKKTGIISPRLLYQNGKIQESARGFPNPFAQFIRGYKLDKYFQWASWYRSVVPDLTKVNEPISVDWVIGAFMLMRRTVVFEVGLFDEGYFMYYEDADLCVKMRKKGYSIQYNPDYAATHMYRRSSSKKIMTRVRYAHIMSIIRFYVKHIFYLLRQ